MTGIPFLNFDVFTFSQMPLSASVNSLPGNKPTGTLRSKKKEEEQRCSRESHNTKHPPAFNCT
jgi:hypothetical protein